MKWLIATMVLVVLGLVCAGLVSAARRCVKAGLKPQVKFRPYRTKMERAVTWGAWGFGCAVVAVLGMMNLTWGVYAATGFLAIGASMSLSIYTDLPTYSFQENVNDALTGKEGYPVELVAGTLKIQLFNAGVYIGDLFERLEGSHTWGVNLRGPIKKAISSGAINTPAYVKMTAAGLAAAAQNEKCCGVAIYPAVCAAGDQVSYIKTDCVMP